MLIGFSNVQGDPKVVNANVIVHHVGFGSGNKLHKSQLANSLTHSSRDLDHDLL